MELLIGLCLGLWWAHHRIKRYRDQVVVTLEIHELPTADHSQ